MASKYITIHQYEPLQTPSDWTGAERNLVRQISDTFDDLYRRMNRLRYEDLGSGLQKKIDEIGLRVEIMASQGVMLTERIPQTVLSARVYKGYEQVTDLIDASRFVWSRFTQDDMADMIWNDAHQGVKRVTVSTEDVTREATFQCDILGEE